MEHTFGKMTSKKQQSLTYLSLGVTSIQSFPIRTTGQLFLHSCLNWTSRSELLWHNQHYYHQCFHITHHYNSLNIVSIMHGSTWEENHLISHLHLLGLHLSVETMAILVSLSCSSSCCFFFGGISLPLSNAKDLPWAWSVIWIKEIQDTGQEEEA